jgi:hypothetical protein
VPVAQDFSPATRFEPNGGAVRNRWREGALSILAELLFEVLLAPDIAPETPRGWLWVSLLFGTAVSGVLAYRLLTSPSEADASIVLAFLGAPLGMFFSVLHFVRAPNDRVLSLSTFVVNGTAVILALALWPEGRTA